MSNDRRTFLERRSLDCAHVEEQLDSYIDAELSPVMVSRFEQHIAECDHCRTLVEDCKQISKMARSLADTEVPPLVRLRLRQALKERVGYESAAIKPPLVLIKNSGN